jgi:hypothetical protein
LVTIVLASRSSWVWASNQVISLLAGIEAELSFSTELLPNTEHDLVEAREISEGDLLRAALFVIAAAVKSGHAP